MKQSLLTLAALSLVLGWGVAYAQGGPGTPPSAEGIIASIPWSTLTSVGDSISQRDAQAYEHLDFLGRFGVQFKPHMAVCDVTQSGAHCDSRVITDSSGRQPSASVALPSGYGPAQFLEAYDLPGKAPGEKIIGIVDAYDDPNIASDLSHYASTYGIPSLPTCTVAIASSPTPCFEKANENGSTTSHPASNSSWAVEISLDVEIAHATCQNCSILLVEASSNSFNDLVTAENRAVALGANAVSNSWGAPEFAGESTYDSYFDHPGVAVTVSAGDDGYGVEYPAASPYVTAVGGTSLFLNNGTYDEELVWSGTGSGCSASESQPAFQTALGLSGCSHRIDNDVAADADPNTGAAVYDSVRFDGMSGWFQVGGTSLASPIVASTYVQSGDTAGGANSIPYALGNASNLHHITSGSNGSCGGSYLCTAGPGYNGPTGVGSPDGVTAF